MRYFKFRTCNNDNFRALENYKIYASLLSDFNDPFEGDAWEDTEADFSIQTHNQGERQELKNSLNNRSYYCISASNNDEILCKNIQMWSHYADSHKGFCVEYNEHLFDSLEQNKGENTFVQIEYNDSLPEFSSEWEKKDRNQRILSIVSRKSEGWKLEQEIRLIFRGKGLKSISKESIVAIYLGCKINEYDELVLRHIANKMNIPCFKMKKSKQLYKLQIDDEKE